MSHYVYLVRHGEQRDAEHGVSDSPLSDRGVRQAERLAERLQGVPFDRILSSPLDRAWQTADIVSHGARAHPPVQASTLLFECIPTGLTDDTPACFEPFLSGFSALDTEAGEAQMADAADALLARTRDDEHTLAVTHDFVIGALVCRALELPKWRWLSMSSVHTGVTILRIRSAKPVELVAFSDVGHLPADLVTGTSRAQLGV